MRKIDDGTKSRPPLMKNSKCFSRTIATLVYGIVCGKSNTRKWKLIGERIRLCGGKKNLEKERENTIHIELERERASRWRNKDTFSQPHTLDKIISSVVALLDHSRTGLQAWPESWKIAWPEILETFFLFSFLKEM